MTADPAARSLWGASGPGDFPVKPITGGNGP